MKINPACTWKIVFVVLALATGMAFLQPAYGSDKEMLEQYWYERYGGFTPSLDSYPFSWDRLAKAQVDECYFGLGDTRNRPSFNAVYPGDFSDADIQACLNASAKPKINQAYVWGLAKSGDNVWFGTVANTLCLVFNGFYGPMTPPPMENGSWACEMSGKDVRPPRIFMYNTESRDLTDMTQKVIAGGDQALLLATMGLRSAGSMNGVVFLGGVSVRGTVTMFAFNGQTGDYLGGREYTNYTNIRQWRVIKKQLYTGVGKRGGGEILRWIGNLSTPFLFETVGIVQGYPAYLVEHKGRLYASTWGGPTGSRGMVLSMSPPLGKDQKLTSLDTNWTIVWQLSEYEVEDSAAQGGGALESYGPYLYWGTMHVPGTGLVYYSSLYPGAPVDAAAFLGSYRPIMIFRGRDFDKKQKKVELLYGNFLLPKYNKEAAQWGLVPNNMNQIPKFGLAGMNNFFNNYTWAMQAYHGKVFVGTMDWLYLGGVIAEMMGVDIPESIHAIAKNFDGADLHTFVSPELPAVPVSFDGLGNYLNYGIRTMLADDFLYLGTANPMNLETGGELKGGWELYKLGDSDWRSSHDRDKKK